MCCWLFRWIRLHSWKLPFVQSTRLCHWTTSKRGQIIREKNFPQFYLVAQIDFFSIGQLQREVRLLENRASHSLIYPVAKNDNISICNTSALCDLIIVILSYLISSRQVRLSVKSAQIDHISIVMHLLFVILSLKTGRKTCDREIYSTYKLIMIISPLKCICSLCSYDLKHVIERYTSHQSFACYLRQTLTAVSKP